MTSSLLLLQVACKVNFLLLPTLSAMHLQQEQAGVQPDTADGPWKQVGRHGGSRRSHRASQWNLTEPGSRSSMHQRSLAAPSTSRKGSMQPSASSAKPHGLHANPSDQLAGQPVEISEASWTAWRSPERTCAANLQEQQG